MYGIRAATVVLALVIGGCRGGLNGVRFQSRDGQSPTVATAAGDWNDVEAAAIVAATKSEMAVLMVAPQEERIVIDLTSIQDEPVRVMVRRASAGSRTSTGDNPDESLLELQCRVGRFGDPARERAFLTAMARRLGELHHRGWSPVRF